MNTPKWEAIVEAIEGYRACPEQAQFDSLRDALATCTLYVPVGDFDGNNAVISPLNSAQGGSFIPLYAAKENVQPAQHSEGVRPADWQHILSQLSSVDGCVIEPYSVNFAFDRRFVDALVKAGEYKDENQNDDSEESVEAVVDEGSGSASGGESVHALLPSGLEGSGGNEPTDVSDSPDTPEASEASSSAEPKESHHISVPNSVPDSLGEAVQAVSDEFSSLAWIFVTLQEGKEQSYLMVLDVPVPWFWFNDKGAEAVNNVLERFPDPGLPLDFVARESSVGVCAEGHAPHYYPRISGASENKAAKEKRGQSHGFFRRLFRR